MFSFNGADDELNGKMVERELWMKGIGGEGVGRPIGYLSSLTASTIHCWHSCKIAPLLMLILFKYMAVAPMGGS